MPKRIVEEVSAKSSKFLNQDERSKRSNMKNIVKNISYSFLANIFSSLTSALLILFMPKMMSLEDYGIWQLFIFYFGYVGFLHLGWLDGIYLRYGNYDYDQMDKDVFGGQFLLLTVLFLLEFLLIATIATSHQFASPYMSFVLFCVGLASVFVNLDCMNSYLLQVSNRIKKYSFNVFTQKFITLVATISLLCLGCNTHRWIIPVTIFSYLVVAIIGFYFNKEVLSHFKFNFASSLKEARVNISVGSKLMFANVASFLVLGIVRYGISMGWDVVTFGKVSLTLSISNFLMLFINAVSIVLFPTLKRIDTDRLKDIYVTLRNLLSIALLGLMLAYYPLRFVLELWLPKYSDALVFMGCLFPICIFESKMQMLINNYLKVLRKEALMLRINLASVAFASLTTYITVAVLHNLKLAVTAIVLNFAFRLVLAEHFMEKFANLNFRRERFVELCMVAGYILANNFLPKIALLIYVTLYLAYLAFHKRELTDIKSNLKTLLD